MDKLEELEDKLARLDDYAFCISKNVDHDRKKLKKRVKELEKEVDQANRYIGEILLRLDNLEKMPDMSIDPLWDEPHRRIRLSSEPTFQFTLPKQGK